MKGYKAFNKDLTCRDFQYEVGHTYEMEDKPIICNKGFHFCKSISDTYKFYDMKDSTRICEVEAFGDIVTEDNIKFCTNKIKIIREITDPVQRKANTNSSSSGFCNSGDRNSGNCNSGDWNSSSFNSGCFSTEEHKINMFDGQSDWFYMDWLNSSARDILYHCPQSETVLEWINDSDMTDEEKKANPTYKTTGGYLKVTKENGNRQEWWDHLAEEDKDKVKALPNFDAEKFYKCTGIRV